MKAWQWLAWQCLPVLVGFDACRLPTCRHCRPLPRYHPHHASNFLGFDACRLPTCRHCQPLPRHRRRRAGNCQALMPAGWQSVGFAGPLQRHRPHHASNSQALLQVVQPAGIAAPWPCVANLQALPALCHDITRIMPEI